MFIPLENDILLFWSPFLGTSSEINVDHITVVNIQIKVGTFPPFAGLLGKSAPTSLLTNVCNKERHIDLGATSIDTSMLKTNRAFFAR